VNILTQFHSRINREFLVYAIDWQQSRFSLEMKPMWSHDIYFTLMSFVRRILTTLAYDTGLGRQR